MRRKRYQSGTLKKRSAKWIGQWWDGETRRNRLLGLSSSMSKSKAMAAMNEILAELRISQSNLPADVSLGQFIESFYYPF